MKKKTDWPRIRNLPIEEQEPFSNFLRRQTVPHLEGVPREEQDGYYTYDYLRWKEGLPIDD